MSENNITGSGAIKQRLLSLYESASPQFFTQLLVDYDAANQKIDTAATKIYDLRAAARLQILFADGFKPAAAIKFLQAAINHIETFGLPPSSAPTLYPNESASPLRPVRLPSTDIARHAEPKVGTLQSRAPAVAVIMPVPIGGLAQIPREGYRLQEIKATRASMVGRIPALLSALYGSRHLTSLSLNATDEELNA